MKIGIFTDTYTPDINGVVTSVVTLQHELERKGHEVYVVTAHKSFLKAKREGNIFRLPGVEMKFLYGYTMGTPYNPQVAEEIAKLGLDVIHVQQEFPVSIFGRSLGRKLGIPVVYTYHTLYEDYTHYLNFLNIDSLESASKKIFEQFSRYMCYSAQCIIAPSNKTRKKLLEYRVTRPIYVIPSGIDLERFKDENIDTDHLQAIKQQWHIGENEPLLVYVGRIAAEKSLDIVIDGFAKVKKDTCRLLIVGGGPSLDDLKKQAAKLGIEERIIFTDKVVAEDVPYYYHLAKAFVSASKSETQGLTFIEALAAGLPLFARPDEVLDDLVEEGKSGYLCESKESFAQKCEAYFALDDNTVNQMRIDCRKIADKYDVETFGRNVLSVYQMAIDNYQDCFTITQIRGSDDCMRLYLENHKQKVETTLLVALDDYMLYELKKGGTLEFVTYESLKEKEKVIITYRKCMRKLRARDRTRKEMYDFMINQDDPIDIKYINDIIDKLEEKGYINDWSYTISAADKLDTSLMGKRKIIQRLVEKGIPRKMVEDYLSQNSEEHELEKVRKKAVKYYDAIKNKSVKDKKITIRNKLYGDGFSTDAVNEVMNELNFEDDIMKEAIVLSNTVENIYRTYAKKYQGEELKQRIIRFCMRKGFMYDDIIHALEMRESNENN